MHWHAAYRAFATFPLDTRVSDLTTPGAQPLIPYQDALNACLHQHVRQRLIKHGCLWYVCANNSTLMLKDQR
jgi:hypothetical protein